MIHQTMNRNITSTLAFLTISLHMVFGQTSVTNRVRPQVGDSLYYSIDTAFSTLDYGTPGSNKSWDFSNLGTTGTRSEVYQPASNGKLASRFPTADAVLIQGINEQYFKFYQDRAELLGTGTTGGGPVPGLGGANVFPKPVVVQKFPENYQDELMYTTSNSVALPSSILPDSLLNTLPLKPDSFKIIFSQLYQKKADAWGVLKLPAKSWNVLREIRTVTTQTRVEAKVPILGWLDVTNLAAGVFGNLFGNINSTSYAFVSNETKGAVAVVNVDTLGNVLSVSYKPDDQTLTKVEVASASESLYIYPNPASNRLQIAGALSTIHHATSYTLMDSNGKELYRGTLLPSDLSIGLESIADGLYFLRLMDENGRLLSAGSFIKSTR